jgi:uncharacterized membrane protein YgdD (TMEM256/DUF423 family)
MRARTWWTLGCVLGFIGVAGGAFGAHGLKSMVPPERLATWSTGADYIQIHAVALIGLGAARLHLEHRALDVAGVAFGLGTLLFTGSLWSLVLLDLPILGAVTPLGGVSFLVGWAAAAVGGARGTVRSA